MRKYLSFLFLLSSVIAVGQKLPDGVTTRLAPCNLLSGLSSTYFDKNNEMIAMIEPSGCNYGNSTIKTESVFLADFYPASLKKTFSTNNDAMKWVISNIEGFYKPVKVTSWLKVSNASPKINLNYPNGWNYKTTKQDWLTKNKSKDDDRLVVLSPNNSEIIQIIRIPNTAKQTTKQVMDYTARFNRAIDFKANPPKDIIIGGKTFKTMENSFASLMTQQHFWFADDKEIIYIGTGLLKDDRVRYPTVVAEVVRSIVW